MTRWRKRKSDQASARSIPSILLLLAFLFFTFFSTRSKASPGSKVSFGIASVALGLQNKSHPFSDRNGEYWLPLLQKNRACYAKVHGLDFYLDFESDIELPSPHWYKPYMAMKYLPKQDWLLLIDADVFITNFTKTLHSFTSSVSDNIHVIFPTETVNCWFSNWGMLIRNSDVGMEFLNRWFEGMAPNHWWQDQCMMWKVVLDMAAETNGYEFPPFLNCTRYSPFDGGTNFCAHVTAMFDERMSEMGIDCLDIESRKVLPPFVWTKSGTPNNGFNTGLAYESRRYQHMGEVYEQGFMFHKIDHMQYYCGYTAYYMNDICGDEDTLKDCRERDFRKVCINNKCP